MIKKNDKQATQIVRYQFSNIRLDYVISIGISISRNNKISESFGLSYHYLIGEKPYSLFGNFQYKN